MAGSKSDLFEIDLLKWATGQTTAIVGGTANTPFLALFTTAPTESTGGTEASFTGYARHASASKWAVPSAGSVTTNADCLFAAKTDVGTVTIVAIGIMTAVTAGSLLYYADLRDGSNNVVTKILGQGDQFRVTAGNFTVTED